MVRFTKNVTFVAICRNSERCVFVYLSLDIRVTVVLTFFISVNSFANSLQHFSFIYSVNITVSIILHVIIMLTLYETKMSQTVQFAGKFDNNYFHENRKEKLKTKEINMTT